MGYYCTDAQVTALLPATLTGTDLATEAARAAKLLAPAKAWVDSVYPTLAPFPSVSAASGYLINAGSHLAGDLSVAIDTGTGTPVAGDYFRVEGHNAWYKVTAWASPTLSYTWVDSYRSGVETTTSGALAPFLDNALIDFGTPLLLQQAASWYARGIAYWILRNSPNDDAATASFEQARSLLQIGRDGLAKARPWVWQSEAWDAGAADDPFPTAFVELQR